MDKKFFIGLFLISLLVLSGGCSDSNSPVTQETNVSEAWNGVWASSSNGAATLTSANYDDVSALIDAFGALPSDVLEQLKIDSPDMYKLYENMNQGPVETVNASVTRVMAIFEDCDISRDKGTAKLTAIVIVSNDTSYFPVFLNGVALETTRISTNEWTAKASNGGTFSINMPSEEEINLSGKLPDYECEFSAVIKKNPSNSIQPAEILDGIWQFDGTPGGGHFAVGSSILSALIPEKVSIAIQKTKEENSSLGSSITSFYSVFMNEKGKDMPVFQGISPASGGTLTQIHDNLCKFKNESGDESLIVIENTDEIFVFQTESADNLQTCMFLPLKKVSFDVEKALQKSWRASKGEGGGYIKINAAFFNNVNDEPLRASLKDIATISLTLKSSTIEFSDATWNDDGTITATMNIATSFSYTNDILHAIGFPEDNLAHNESGKVTMTPFGNFLQFEYDGDIYNVSFISDTEAFFSLEAETGGQGEAMYYVRLSAE